MNWWTHTVADIGDWFPGGLYGLALTVLLLGIATGLLLQPFGLYRINFGDRRKKVTPAADIIVAEPAGEAELPDVPSDALLAQAHQYMAHGDYRAAVREWLRLMVRDLVERGIIEHRPGWTVTELATAAGHALPPIAADLDEAGTIFSAIWYGGAVADPPNATRMRDLQVQIATAASTHPPIGTYTVESS